jgi:hypothetical protein
MGLCKSAWITCDRDGCTASIGRSSPFLFDEQEASNYAGDSGWQKDNNGRWECPDHKKPATEGAHHMTTEEQRLDDLGKRTRLASIQRGEINMPGSSVGVTPWEELNAQCKEVWIARHRNPAVQP